MADGSRHSLAMVAESTYGTTPSTPTWTALRHTNCNLGLNKGSFQSEELRSDRNITDFRHSAKSVNNGFDFELSYGSFDDAVEALLGGTWADRGTITGTTISAAAADNSYNDSGNGFVTAGFEVGDTVTVTGFTGDVANNISSGVITALTAGKMTIGGTDGDVIVDDAAGESVTIVSAADRVKNGTTRRSWTIERIFADLDSGEYPYHRFTGCEFSTMELTLPADGKVTGTFGVAGQTLSLDTAEVASSTYSAATTTAMMDSFTGTLKEGGSEIAIVTEASISVDNGMAPRFVVGDNKTIQSSIARCNVTGNVTVYFEDATMYNKFLNETESSLDITLDDPSGNTHRIYLPRVKYMVGNPDTSGDGPITLNMPFQAYMDATDSYTIAFDREAA